MHPALKVQRRVLLQSYEIYVLADREWRAALYEAASYVPDVPSKHIWSIGSPQSRLRKLFEARTHAVDRITVARIKLRRAQERIENPQSPPRLLL